MLSGLLPKGIFCKLVATHIHAIRKQFVGMVINLYIWAFCTLVIMGYIMQSFGLSADYGVFQFAGIVGTVGLFEIFGNVSKNIMDFEGDSHISYNLTLPTRPWIVFGALATFYTLVGVVLTCVLFPFGAGVLYSHFDITSVSWIKAAIMLILANLFFAVFTLLITAYVGSMSKIRNIWARFIFPLWMLGGFQFSWAILYSISKPLAYAVLFDPLIFIMEGCRAAILGQQEYLSWELCVIMISIYTMLCWIAMYYRMKRLLDFV